MQPNVVFHGLTQIDRFPEYLRTEKNAVFFIGTTSSNFVRTVIKLIILLIE